MSILQSPDETQDVRHSFHRLKFSRTKSKLPSEDYRVPDAVKPPRTSTELQAAPVAGASPPDAAEKATQRALLCITTTSRRLSISISG